MNDNNFSFHCSSHEVEVPDRAEFPNMDDENIQDKERFAR